MGICLVRLIASLKYDKYGDYVAGVRFTEGLAGWLAQFDQAVCYVLRRCLEVWAQVGGRPASYFLPCRSDKRMQPSTGPTTRSISVPEIPS